MLRSRIIPCLLVHRKGLVKTVNFREPKYVGDPINAVKIFNEKEVDELIVLDIDATKEKRGPDFTLIRNLAAECRMPFCYGGGISSVEQARKIISLGAEKVALSSAVIDDPLLCKEIGNAVGVQSVVVVLDVRKRKLLGGYDIFTHNGKVKSKRKFKEFVVELNTIGVGEIVVNSIDNDGKMTGYDMELATLVRDLCDTPITVIGAAAGSLFVFKGKYKAVLINYPNRVEKFPLY